MWSRDLDSPDGMARSWGPESKGKKKLAARTSKSSQQEIIYHMDHERAFGGNIKAHQLSEFEIQECKEAFSMFDTNKTGKINNEKLGNVLKILGHQLTQEEITDLLLEVDEEGNGSIDFPEFLSLMAAMQCNRDDEELREAFLMLDQNNTGDIGERELSQMMTKLGHTLSDAELREMIREADTTGNGRISYEEFATMMNQAPR